MKKISLFEGAILMAAALVLAGCGSSSDSSGAAEGTTAAAAQSGDIDEDAGSGVQDVSDGQDKSTAGNASENDGGDAQNATDAQDASDGQEKSAGDADSDFLNGVNEFTPAIFEQDSSVYNRDLAWVAAQLSEKAEDEDGSWIKYQYDYYGIYAADLYYSDDRLLDISEDLSKKLGGGRFALGQSSLDINGEPWTILIVTTRGTQTWSEGIGDFFHGPTENLKGYEVSGNVYEYEEEVWRGINAYVAAYPILRDTDHLKVLITGHSLGGAAANLLGARFNCEVADGTLWNKSLRKEDIYVYTFGAIKTLTDAESYTNFEDGFENIHNIYNYFDTFGPNGLNAWTYANVSTPYCKFGHTELFTPTGKVSESDSYFGSTDQHNMPTYINNLDVVTCALESGGDGADYDSESDEALTSEEASDAVSTPEEADAAGTDFADGGSYSGSFSIEGTWESTGSYGFGQAQPGALVTFDGENCNFFSPMDTYTFTSDGSSGVLECTSFLFSDTLQFDVEIVDNDLIYVYFDGSETELTRVE